MEREIVIVKTSIAPLRTLLNANPSLSPVEMYPSVPLIVPIHRSTLSRAFASLLHVATKGVHAPADDSNLHKRSGADLGSERLLMTEMR